MRRISFLFLFVALLSACTKTEKINAPEVLEDYGGIFIKKTNNKQTKWGLEIYKKSTSGKENRRLVIPIEYDSIAVGIGNKYMALKGNTWQLFNNIDGKLMFDGLSFYSAEPEWLSFKVVNMDITAEGGSQPFVEGTHFRLKTLDGYYAAFIRKDLRTWSLYGPFEDYWPAINGFFIIENGKVGFADVNISRYLEPIQKGRSFAPLYDVLIEVIGQERQTPRKGFLAYKDGKWISLTEYGNPGKWSESYIEKLLSIPTINPDDFEDMVIYLGNRYNVYYTKIMSHDGKCGKIYINGLAGEKEEEPKM